MKSKDARGTAYSCGIEGTMGYSESQIGYLANNSIFIAYDDRLSIETSSPRLIWRLSVSLHHSVGGIEELYF
jgi:hypothetical protein